MVLGGGAEKFKYCPPTGYSGLCDAVLPGKVWVWVPDRLFNTRLTGCALCVCVWCVCVCVCVVCVCVCVVCVCMCVCVCVVCVWYVGSKGCGV